MRFIRFESDGEIYTGVPDDDRLTTARVVEGELFGSYAVGPETRVVDRLLAPVVPTDILCIGLNYRAHAAETNSEPPANPMLFIKASGTLNRPGGTIPIPRLSGQIDYEAELAVVVGRDAKDVPRDKALDYVFGYACANDVSARDWQKDKNLGGGQFARGKSFDGFCPLGPALVTKDEVGDPNRLRIRCEVNGQTLQDGNTGDMIFDVPALIESLSSTMTIRAGTVILTGTPAGVGMGRTPPAWLKPGDRVAVEIDKLGRLENVVA